MQIKIKIQIVLFKRENKYTAHEPSVVLQRDITRRYHLYLNTSRID